MRVVSIHVCLVVCLVLARSSNALFDLLNNKTLERYGNHDQAMQTVKHSFVCTDPNAKFFGGFGNFMITIYGVQTVALMTDRVPVMNHLLFLSMFDHPDPRQSWDLVPHDQYKNLQRTVLTRPSRCPELLDQPLNRMPPKYGVNGCLHTYFDHKQGAVILNQLMPTRFSTTDVPIAEHLASSIAEWSLSRPTPKWQSIVEKFRSKVFAPCGAGVHHADLAVQFRTWRDVRPEDIAFYEAGGECHQECAKQMALEVQRHLERPICVFVTSDNDTSTAALASAISALDPVNIRTVYVHEVNKQWHSATVVDTARWAFDESTLDEHDELKIWMLLSDARYALSTAGSTYARSARLRAGTARRLGDRQSEFVHQGAGKPPKCTCDKIFPHFGLEDHI